MIFGSSDSEFQVELEDTKKCVHQKYPKDLDSKGKTELSAIDVTNADVILSND